MVVQPQSKSLIAFGVLALFIFGFWMMIGQAQTSNTIEKPIPVAEKDKPLIIKQLPNLAAELQKAKSMAEGQALEAKDLLKRRRDRDAQTARGRGLYVATKAELDGCITYLCTGLDSGFTTDAPDTIANRFRASQQRIGALGEWAEGLKPPQVGAFDPLTALLEMVPNWLNGLKEQDQKVIAKIKADLNACRLADWDALGN
jgi:hypothetical protein